MLTVLMVALLAWTLLFLALFLLRYGVAQLEEKANRPAAVFPPERGASIS
jgi:hypothetical protein